MSEKDFSAGLAAIANDTTGASDQLSHAAPEYRNEAVEKLIKHAQSANGPLWRAIIAWFEHANFDGQAARVDLEIEAFAYRVAAAVAGGNQVRTIAPVVTPAASASAEEGTR